MKNSLKFNTFAYYLSQLFWIFYILIPILFAIFFPKKTKKIKIYSSNTYFNNSKDPILFSHVTDTHINSLRPNSIISFRKTFNLIKSFAPEFVVLTGDIVDNYDSLSHPRFGEQNEASWKIYKEETANFTDIPIIEAGGNHDMFGVQSIFSSKNYLIDSLHSFNRNNIKTEDDFLVHSFRVGPSRTNVIAINPFQFPTSHPPLLLYTSFSSHLLDLIHNEIDKSESKSILISHYPVGSIHSKKSTSGFKFTEMIGWQDSVLAFLSGHSHPKLPQTFHHTNGGLEILGTASFQHSNFGLVTIDNNGISWSTIDIDNPPKGVITYPIPMNQISSNTIFNNKENAEIRVMMFSNRKDLSISFTITEIETENNVYSGKLKYSRPLINGHSLYTFPLNQSIKSNGRYRITFSGDFDGLSEFVINDFFETGGEKLTEYPGIVEMLFITFWTFFLILLIITVFIPLNCFKCQENLDEIEEWIETSNSESNHWIFIFFGSFLLIRTRVQKAPVIIKIFLFFSVLFSIVGPLLFFKTEEMLGFICSYGYFIDKHFYYADYGILYSYFFLGIVCTPMIIICSSFGVKSWSILQIGDVIFCFCALIADVIVLIRIIHQTVGSSLISASIGFISIPIVFMVMFSIWRFIEWKKNKSLKDESIMNNLNDDSLAQNFTSFSSSSSA